MKAEPVRVVKSSQGRSADNQPDTPPPKQARTDPAAFPSGLLLAPFNVSPAPRAIAAKFVPKSAKGFRSPTGAALIHPLSVHRIICGLPSGSGETRRLATPKPSAAVSD